MPSAMFREILEDQKRARNGLQPISVTKDVTNVTSEDLRDLLEGITELVTMVTDLQARVSLVEQAGQSATPAPLMPKRGRADYMRRYRKRLASARNAPATASEATAPVTTA